MHNILIYSYWLPIGLYIRWKKACVGFKNLLYQYWCFASIFASYCYYSTVLKMNFDFHRISGNSAWNET